MKIAQINTVCGNGSVGRITVDLLETLEQSGNEGRVFYGRRQAPVEVDALRFGNSFSFGVHVLSTFITGRHGFSSMMDTKKLIKLLKDYNPDVIHLHNIHGFYVNVEMLFSYLKEAGKPVIWTLHDCWAFTGHCAYFGSCNKWKTICDLCPKQRNDYPYALCHDNSRDNFRRKKQAFTGLDKLILVTPSQWLKEQVEESFLGQYMVRVIPNGIDLHVFTPGEPKDTSPVDTLEILGVANVWDKRKGLEYFQMLYDSLDKKKYHITLVGVGKKQKKALPDEISCISHTRNTEELAEYYRKAQVYVNPTLEDNLPTTNIEALACGTPVVTFATGGSGEMLDDNCGRVVAARDFESLKKEVCVMAAQKTDMSKACVKKALEYDKYKRFGEYIKLYEESINYNNNL